MSKISRKINKTLKGDPQYMQESSKLPKMKTNINHYQSSYLGKNYNINTVGATLRHQMQDPARRRVFTTCLDHWQYETNIYSIPNMAVVVFDEINIYLNVNSMRIIMIKLEKC